MSARPNSEQIFRIAVDLASSRAHQVDFLLRVIEAKSGEGAPRFLRAPADSAELTIRDAAVATGNGERRHLEVARSGHSPATICPTPVPIAEPLNLRSISAALQAAAGTASTGFGPMTAEPDHAAQRAHRVLDGWFRRSTPTVDLHLVGSDGGIVLELLADGRSRLGARFDTLADALRSSWELHLGAATPSATPPPSEPRERALSQTLWELGQLADTEYWLGDLGPEAMVMLRYWPFQAAEGPPAASQTLRRLRKGIASVSELLDLAASERDDVVRVLNACLAIEAIAVVGRDARAPTAAVAEPVPVVVLGEAPSRLHRVLASIRRVLAID